MKYNLPIDFTEMHLGETLSENRSVSVLRPVFVQTPVVAVRPSGTAARVDVGPVDPDRFQVFRDTMLEYTRVLIDEILASYHKWFNAGTLDRETLDEILVIDKYETPEITSGQFILVVYARCVTFSADRVVLTYAIKNQRLVASDTCLIK